MMLLFCRGLCAEDLLVNQPGTTLPVNTWVKVLSTTAGNPAITGYDNLVRVPAIGRSCMLTSFKEITSEQNRALWCYSLAENRWDLWDIGSPFDNENMLHGGHPDNTLAVDPVWSVLYLTNGTMSGSAADQNNRSTWVYDPIAQAGRVKQQTTSHPGSIQEGSDIVDYIRGVVIKQGGGGTNEYNIAGNTWGTTYCTSSGGGCPPPNLLETCAVWSTSDQSMYLFGGALGGSGGTTQNLVYKNHAGTWTALTPSGTAPSARAFPSCAYDANENIILIVSGCTNPGCPTTPIALDTWVLDLNQNAPNGAWVQLSPSGFTSTQLIAPSERMVWDPEDDAFVLVVEPTGGGTETWVFRYRQGQKAGHKTGASYTSAAGLNRSQTAWAKDASISASGNSVLAGWVETGVPADTTNSQYQHPYASQSVAGATTAALGSTYQSMMPDYSSGRSSVTDEMSCAYVGTAPWCSWYSHNTSNLTSTIFARGWDGGGWNVGGTGFIGYYTFANLPAGQVTNAVAEITDAASAGSCAAGGTAHAFCQWNGTSWVTTASSGGAIPLTNASSSSSYGGPSQIFDVNGTPSIAYREEYRDVAAPYHDYVYARQFVSGAWTAPLGGMALNRLGDGTHFTRADSISGASNGTQPCLAWTEYTESNTNTALTTPQAFVSCYNGTSWVPYGASLTTVGTNSSYTPSITWLGGQPYVAEVERSDGGQQLLYVRTTANSGTTWTTVANGSNNCVVVNGCSLSQNVNHSWAQRPWITNDGTNLLVTWTEQANEGPWVVGPVNYAGATAQRPRVYVDKITTGGVVTRLGGALNADTFYGSAAHASIATASGNPAVSWVETKPGTMRKVYAKVWNGADWTSLGAPTPALIITTNSLPASTVGAAYSQTLAATGGTSPYAWSVFTGMLPTGLNLSGDGVISGTSSAAGAFSFTVRVTDNFAATADQALSITINAAPSITTSSLPSSTAGAAYSQTLAATGGTLPYAWSLFSGALPTGLNLSGAGAFSGTPSVPGVVNFTVRVTDNAAVTANQALSITINASAVGTSISGAAVCTGCAMH